VAITLATMYPVRRKGPSMRRPKATGLRTSRLSKMAKPKRFTATNVATAGGDATLATAHKAHPTTTSL